MGVSTIFWYRKKRTWHLGPSRNPENKFLRPFQSKYLYISIWTFFILKKVPFAVYASIFLKYLTLPYLYDAKVKFITVEKAKILGNVFIDSQFNYATLIRMFWRKSVYSEIEKIHHKTLKVIYGIDDFYNNLLCLSSSKALCLSSSKAPSIFSVKDI